MRVTTGTVVNGRIEVPGEGLPEGAEVTILSPEDQEAFTLGAEAEAALLARIEEAERADVISSDELLRELHKPPWGALPARRPTSTAMKRRP